MHHLADLHRLCGLRLKPLIPPEHGPGEVNAVPLSRRFPREAEFLDDVVLPVGQHGVAAAEDVLVGDAMRCLDEFEYAQQAGLPFVDQQICREGIVGDRHHGAGGRREGEERQGKEGSFAGEAPRLTDPRGASVRQRETAGASADENVRIQQAGRTGGTNGGDGRPL